MAGELKLNNVSVATENAGTVTLGNSNVEFNANTVTTNLAFAANHAGIKTALNASGNAPIHACRAFVTYDTHDNLSPASILGTIKSSNVSSVTRVSEGRYEINFTSSLPTANYVVSAIHSFNTQYGNVMSTCTGAKTVDYCEILTIYHYSSYGLHDNDEISVAFFF